MNECLSDWGLGADKIMMIVSDNGSNMTKAIRLLKDMKEDDNEFNEGELNDSDNGSEMDELSMLALRTLSNCLKKYCTEECLVWLTLYSS